MIVAIKTIGNIVLVTNLLQFMYAVIGVQLFKVRLSKKKKKFATKFDEHSCRGNFTNARTPRKTMRMTASELNVFPSFHISNKQLLIPLLIYRGYFIRFKDSDPDIPFAEKREWKNNDFNFDSVTNGMITLFAVSTFEGWPQYEIMRMSIVPAFGLNLLTRFYFHSVFIRRMLYLSVDSKDEDLGPVHDNRKVVAVFYISYLIIISFFMINIFVGFVILTFQNEGEKEYAGCGLEKNQRNCLDFALHAKPQRKYIPESRFQYWAWSIVHSQPFEYSNFTLILLNTVSTVQLQSC